MIFSSTSQKKRNELDTILLKGVIEEWPLDKVWRHQLHNYHTSATLAAKLQSPDEREILTGCQTQTLWSQAEKRTKRQSYVCVQLQKPMVSLTLNTEIQRFHPRLKHSLTPLISEDRSFFLGWGMCTATDTSCLVQTDQPKDLSGHTHYQQHVIGFSARKSNSLPHLLSLSFKDQSCAHSWSLCESCLIN